MGLLLYEFRTSNVILTVSEQRCLFSAILMPQFLIHEFKFCFQFDHSYRPILVFEYQRYGLLSQCFSCLYIFHDTKIYFSSVFNVLGDFLLFNRPAVVVDLVHSHLFTLQFSQSYFSALKHFNYYYSHATSQRQFNAASS